MKIRWELKEKTDVQTFGEWENEFKKQTLIFVEVEPEVEFPNTVAIDFSNDKLSLAGAMEIGWIYDVNFSISCKKTEKGWIFNTIRWRKINAVKTPDEKDAEEVLPFR